MPEARPDECPYPRPFPEGFRDCPTFVANRFTPLTSEYSLLEPEWTCGHLVVGVPDGGTGRFYARCALGDTAARTRWLEGVEAARLEELRALGTELSRATAATMDELYEAKGRHLAALAHGRDPAPELSNMTAIAARFIADTEAFLSGRADQLARLRLPEKALLDLVRELVERWVRQPTAEAPAISEQDLARFPEEARVLFSVTAA